MSRSERFWRGGVVTAAAILVIALSVAEGSILGGVVITTILFGVIAAVLFAGYVLVGANRHTGVSARGWENDEGPPGRLSALVHTLASRPWRAGAGVLTVANAAITGRAGTLVSPRGQRLAAPVLYVEFNTRDLAAATARWPAAVLAGEYVAGYVEHARRVGLKRVADDTVLYVVANASVPVGRVVVTPAFGATEDVEVVAEARAVNSCPPVAAAGGDPDRRGDVPWNGQDAQWTVPSHGQPTQATPQPRQQPILQPTRPTTRRKEELV